MAPSNNPARTFAYGIRSDADRARIKQQNGDYPPPHVFKGFLWNPHLCAYPECFATREGNKPWHLSDAWLAD